MGSEGFRFKQFYVRHDRCAMKVGTDGVLLGAWAPTNPIAPNPVTHNPLTRILDVGTGSGLIALMLAQRCPQAQIDAIDIDEAAVEQARENFENAFSARLHVYRAKLQEWQIVTGKCPNGTSYDLIVSNPPYFQNSLKNPDKGRELARHTDSLSYDELIAHSARLLNEGGQLALILPAEAENEVRQLAAVQNLFLSRVTRVYTKENKPAKRVLMAFGKCTISNFQSPISNLQSPIVEDSLVLENEKGGRSLPYQELCREFY